MSGRGVVRRPIHAAALSVALCSALVLSGCTTANTAIESSVAAGLQSSVVTVGQLAASGDRAGALAELDALAAEVEGAAADGSVSDERLTAIRSSIAQVRADLETASPAPAETAPAETAPEETAPEETAPEETAPVEPTEVAPVDSGDTGSGGDDGTGTGGEGNGNNGNGNSGNGNSGNGNNGNGNGNGNGKKK
ncbi:hypothetical protein [Herbiconiux liangxiaofengii]|uniref:hypothetical protein n=1 Tax=Herbiconiux liangxiaofengii TaxID=3342795 RepID=UPI0035B71666